MPTQATIDAHCAQANPPLFFPSDTLGEDIELLDVCMIPLMWAPYFIGGGTPKATLDKIELMIASVVPADSGDYTNSYPSGAGTPAWLPDCLELRLISPV